MAGKTIIPAIVAVSILAAILLAYSAGYLLLGGCGTVGVTRIRTYHHYWQEVIFRPAAVVEAFVTGDKVLTGTIVE